MCCLEMTLSQSKDQAVTKWNPQEVVQHAHGAFQYRDIVLALPAISLIVLVM